jgi:hypothetical protein
MGTDIHIAVERFNGTKWEWTGIKVKRDRNYDLFAILADVRNGTGFGGIVTGAGFVPISEPRGFPEDVDPRSIGYGEDELEGDPEDHELKEDLWGSKADGQHDETWLLLSEILDYDYSQKTIQCGYMKEEDYARYRESGVLQTYCGSVWGGGVVTLREGQYEALRAGSLSHGDRKIQYDPKGITYYIQTSWEVEYSERVGHWVKAVREQLLPLGDPKLTRLIFNFDS